MQGKADSAESSKAITQSGSRSAAPPAPLSHTQETRPYVCYRCSKSFPSTHALGGHQNAHKKERKEEQSLYEEQRRASKMPLPPVAQPLPTPLFVVPAAVDSGKIYGLLANPELINSVPASQGFMLLQPVAPGFIIDGLKAPVLMPAGFQLGPAGNEVKGGEVSNKASDDKNEKYHPYKKPVNKMSMPWTLCLNGDRDFWAKAEEDSACSTTDGAGPTAQAFINEDKKDAHDPNIPKKELDLTLRL